MEFIMDRFVILLKRYWFLITTVCAISAAWGQAQIKIVTLEDAVKQTTTIRDDVSNLKAKVERIDERTLAFSNEQLRQSRSIEAIERMLMDLTPRTPRAVHRSTIPIEQ